MQFFTTILALLATSILYVSASPAHAPPSNSYRAFVLARANGLSEPLFAKRDSAAAAPWRKRDDVSGDDDDEDLPFCDEVEGVDVNISVGAGGDGDDEEDCDDGEDVDSDGEDGPDDDDGEDDNGDEDCDDGGLEDMMDELV